MKRLFAQWYNAPDELSSYIPATTAIALSRTCIELNSFFGRSRTHIWKRYLESPRYCCHKMLRNTSGLYIENTHALNYRLLVVTFTSNSYALLSLRIRKLIDAGVLARPLHHFMDKFDLDLRIVQMKDYPNTLLRMTRTTEAMSGTSETNNSDAHIIEAFIKSNKSLDGAPARLLNAKRTKVPCDNHHRPLRNGRKRVRSTKGYSGVQTLMATGAKRAVARSSHTKSDDAWGKLACVTTTRL
eukprot:Lankesteria_metandrocarpae@DN4491_c0_g1_i1.p1